MNTKKLLTGAIAGAVVFFLLGWLVYGNLLVSFMKHHTGEKPHLDRKEMKFIFIIIGNLLQGLFLTYIFLKANVNTLINGLITGGVIGLLSGAAIDCIMYGTTYILSKHSMVADIIAATAISAVAGAVIGLVIGEKKTT